MVERKRAEKRYDETSEWNKRRRSTVSERGFPLHSDNNFEGDIFRVN